MSVKCPRHHTILKTENIKITILDTTYEILSGKCDHCHQLYTNFNLLPVFELNRQRYEHLYDLSKIASPKIIPITIQVSPKSKEMFFNKTDKEKNQKKTMGRNIQEFYNNILEKQKQEYLKSKKLAQSKQNSSSTSPNIISNKKNAPNTTYPQNIVAKNFNNIKISYSPVNILYVNNVPKYCTKDKEPLKYIKKIEIPKGGVLGNKIHLDGNCCIKCNTLFLPIAAKEVIEATKSNNASQNKIYQDKIITQTNISHSKLNNQTKQIQFSSNENILYVFKSTQFCIKNQHPVYPVTGILDGLRGEIKININYCPICDKCFIGLNEYKYYKKLYKALLGNIKIVHSSFKDNTLGFLADESILHICGYTVNQGDGLSETHRRYILSYLIDHSIISKPEVIDYLNFFINRNGKKRNMSEALLKWQGDLDWIRNYKIDKQGAVTITKIRRN